MAILTFNSPPGKLQTRVNTRFETPNIMRNLLYGTPILALVLVVAIQFPGLHSACAMCADAPAEMMPCHAKSASTSAQQVVIDAACCCKIGAVPEQTDTDTPNLLAELPTAQSKNHLWHAVVSLRQPSRKTPSSETPRLDSSLRSIGTPLFVLNSSFLI